MCYSSLSIDFLNRGLWFVAWLTSSEVCLAPFPKSKKISYLRSKPWESK